MVTIVAVRILISVLLSKKSDRINAVYHIHTTKRDVVGRFDFAGDGLKYP